MGFYLNKEMGSSISKNLDNETLAELYLNSEFDEIEIQQIYEEFLNTTGQLSKEFKEWEVDKENFRSLARKYFPDQKSKIFTEQIFRVYDQDKNGMLNFREFLIGLSIIKRSPIQDKLYTLFNFYDMNSSGSISRTELDIMMKAIDNFARRSMSKYQTSTEVIFDHLDMNNDGKVTFKEFRKAMLGNHKLVQLLDF